MNKVIELYGKDDRITILDLGYNGVLESVSLLTHFPNSILYVLDLKGMELSERVKKYTNEKIDICFINDNNYKYLEDKVPLRNIDIVFNNNGIIYNNLKSGLEMFCVFHKTYYFRPDNFYFTFFGVNETYPKKESKNAIMEFNLNKYDPFLQKRGYMETSAYLHVYWNNMHKGRKMIGFSQYDMQHDITYDNLDTNTIYFLAKKDAIVKNKRWNNVMFPNLRNLDFLLKSYNNHFKTNYGLKELENKPFSLWQTNIYPVKTYEKLCGWFEKLVKDIYPWSNRPPYETHFGSIGGYTERALSIFNAFEIHEGMKYKTLSIRHGVGAVVKEQYNKKSFLNAYDQDIHCIVVKNKHMDGF